MNQFMYDREITPSGSEFQPWTMFENPNLRWDFPILHGHQWWILIFPYLFNMPFDTIYEHREKKNVDKDVS